MSKYFTIIYWAGKLYIKCGLALFLVKYTFTMTYSVRPEFRLLRCKVPHQNGGVWLPACSLCPSVPTPGSSCMVGSILGMHMNALVCMPMLYALAPPLPNTFPSSLGASPLPVCITAGEMDLGNRHEQEWEWAQGLMAGIHGSGYWERAVGWGLGPVWAPRAVCGGATAGEK